MIRNFFASVAASTERSIVTPAKALPYKRAGVFPNASPPAPSRTPVCRESPRRGRCPRADLLDSAVTRADPRRGVAAAVSSVTRQQPHRCRDTRDPRLAPTVRKEPLRGVRAGVAHRTSRTLRELTKARRALHGLSAPAGSGARPRRPTLPRPQVQAQRCIGLDDIDTDGAHSSLTFGRCDNGCGSQPNRLRVAVVADVSDKQQHGQSAEGSRAGLDQRHELVEERIRPARRGRRVPGPTFAPARPVRDVVDDEQLEEVGDDPIEQERLLRRVSAQTSSR